MKEEKIISKYPLHWAGNSIFFFFILTLGGNIWANTNKKCQRDMYKRACITIMSYDNDFVWFQGLLQ